MKFAKRILQVQPSATLAAAQKKRDLEQKGVKVLDFTVGEPDFPTPEVVKETAKRAIDANDTYYTPVPGTLELRKAICEKFKTDNGLDYSSDEILVSAGAKNIIYEALQVLVEEGDEVIIPTPYWVSYSEQVRLVEGTPIFIQTDDRSQFKITPQQLEKAITKKTKMFILNSPSNPTGMAYTGPELKALGEVCKKHDFCILADEIYEKLVFDGFRHESFAAVCPALKERTITVNGASKAYSMTGWRMGYAAGPKPVIDKMKIVQSQGVTCIPGFVQQACVTALQKTSKNVAEMVVAFQKRRDIMVEGFNSIPGISCVKPNGAFYCFPNMQAAVKKLGLKDTNELSNFLLEQLHIATVSGEGFGAPGYIRFSYATDLKSIEEALKKMKARFS